MIVLTLVKVIDSTSFSLQIRLRNTEEINNSFLVSDIQASKQN